MNGISSLPEQARAFSAAVRAGLGGARPGDAAFFAPPPGQRRVGPPRFTPRSPGRFPEFRSGWGF